MRVFKTKHSPAFILSNLHAALRVINIFFRAACSLESPKFMAADSRLGGQAPGALWVGLDALLTAGGACDTRLCFDPPACSSCSLAWQKQQWEKAEQLHRHPANHSKTFDYWGWGIFIRKSTNTQITHLDVAAAVLENLPCVWYGLGDVGPGSWLVCFWKQQVCLWKEKNMVSLIGSVTVDSSESV